MVMTHAKEIDLEMYQMGIRRGHIVRPPMNLERFIPKIETMEDRARLLHSYCQKPGDDLTEEEARKIAHQLRFFRDTITKDYDEFHGTLDTINFVLDEDLLQSLHWLEQLWNEAWHAMLGAKVLACEKLEAFVERNPQFQEEYDPSSF